MVAIINPYERMVSVLEKLHRTRVHPEQKYAMNWAVFRTVSADMAPLRCKCSKMRPKSNAEPNRAMYGKTHSTPDSIMLNPNTSEK